MPKRLLIDAQPSFVGGLNTSADESQLQPNEMRNAQNARLTEYGGAVKRFGTQRVHAAAIGSGNPVRGGFHWARPGVADQQLAVANGTLYTGTYAIPMTWTSQTGALSTTVPPSFATFHDGTGEVVYIADGGALNKWDGTTLSVNLAGTPNVTQIVVHNLRLFGIGDPSNPLRLYWSALSDGDTLNDVANGGGATDIRTFGQSELIGLMPIGNSLMIFHRDGISRFTGYSQDDIDIDSGTRGVSSDVGTIAPNSLVAVENMGFFLSDRGIYMVTEGGVQPIATKIENTIKGFSQSDFDLVYGAHNRAAREVIFFFPGAGAYVYNYRVGQWVGPWTGTYSDDSPAVVSMWEALDGSDRPIVLAGGSDGFVRHLDRTDVYRDDVLSDDSGGAIITMILQLHRMFFGTQIIEKSLRYIFVTFNPRAAPVGSVVWTTGPVSGSHSLPNIDVGAIWGQFEWGEATWGSSGSAVGRTQSWGTGFYADISIVDDTESNPIYSRVEAHAFGLAARF